MSPPSLPRNRLLAALKPADLHLLRPHLSPVTLKLRQDLEKPNIKIEDLYFLDAGIASVVAMHKRKERVEVGLIGCDGMSGTAIVLGNQVISAFMLFAGGWQGTAHFSRRTSQGHGREQDPARIAAQIRSDIHGTDCPYSDSERPSQNSRATGALDFDGRRSGL